MTSILAIASIPPPVVTRLTGADKNRAAAPPDSVPGAPGGIAKKPVAETNLRAVLADGATLLGAQESAKGEKRTAGPSDTFQLSDEQKQQVADLKKRDAEVRRHEQAHAQTGGQYAGAPSYSFERGPDGRSYAVGGEVPIDVSPIAGDPQATVRKMQQVQRAALAPADPSGADRAIAARAAALKMHAQAEAAEQRAEGLKETFEGGNEATTNNVEEPGKGLTIQAPDPTAGFGTSTSGNGGHTEGPPTPSGNTPEDIIQTLSLIA